MKLLTKHIIKEDITDKAANGIANGILNSQNSFARHMFFITKKWKQKHQWIFLYMVCLIFGGMSILAIVRPFKIKEMNKVFMPKFINIPKNIVPKNRVLVITENEFQKVQEYKQKHPNLEKEKPGLSDSLGLIEQIYYSQKK